MHINELCCVLNWTRTARVRLILPLHLAFYLKWTPKPGLKTTKIVSFRHFSVSFYTLKKSRILPQKHHFPHHNPQNGMLRLHFTLIWMGSSTRDYHSRLQFRTTIGIANDDICVGDMMNGSHSFFRLVERAFWCLASKRHSRKAVWAMERWGWLKRFLGSNFFIRARAPSRFAIRPRWLCG